MAQNKAHNVRLFLASPWGTSLKGGISKDFPSLGAESQDETCPSCFS
jgi:hypothetical protein